MKTYQVAPLDTLFFRDGRPFNLGETGQMEVEGSFPPSPTTLVGAMRAALARSRGWTSGAWNDALVSVLGNRHETLGQLSFQGPFLVRNGKALFPAPLHLLGKHVEIENSKGKEWLTTRLRPGDLLRTDIEIKEVRLPEKVEDIAGLKELDAYLTAEGMKCVLGSRKPESSHIVSKACLWKTEPRVGIRRDVDSRTTKEDALYNVSHVRLQEGVMLGAQVKGVPERWQPQSPALLGGESRMVWLDEVQGLELPKAPTLQERDGIIRYTATLITPGKLHGDGWRIPNAKLADLPGTVVSACVGKPQMIGGWDSLNREPLPLVPHLPAGSTWFLEAKADKKDEILSKHGKHIGEKTDWGYGQILIGAWEDTKR